ncbi:MAG: hypothetical protein HZB86_00635 [Deltaproteobacteria bacterium]|nr:hypothetical protein [Deltaproteobacteria bacterium]
MIRRLLFAGVLPFLAAGCSTMQANAIDPMDRARGIQAKISEAERLGARSCSPRELAKAKVALDHLIHEVDEGYYTAAWLEPDFVAADKAVQELLEERKVAAAVGGRFRCVSRSVDDPAGEGNRERPGG